MTVFDFIERHAEASRLALQMENGETITYRQLKSCLIHNQKRLAEQGRYSGKRVVLVDAGGRFVLELLCLLYAGCWIIPVPDGLTHKELQEIRKQTNAVSLPDGVIRWEVGEEGNCALQSPCPDSCGILHRTSGSTGRPKYCIRTLKALTAEALSYRECFSLMNTDRLLSASPLCHSFALGASLMSGLVAGACQVISGGFSPRKLNKTVSESNITAAFMVPFMARLLCGSMFASPPDWSRLRFVLVGAGKVNEWQSNAFYKKFGVWLLSNYGSTETGGLLSRLEAMPAESVGRPMPGVEIELRNVDGTKAAQGQLGEVWVKRDGMLLGYLEGKAAFDQDGFFPMGDYAYQNRDGMFFITGRKGRNFKIGGRSINPLEVEEILLQLPGVEECIVLETHKTNGESALKACVVLRDEMTDLEIRNYCAQQLSRYKVPSIIQRFTELPKSASGKILTQKLEKEEREL